MSLYNPFHQFAFGDIFESILPDFVLAFAFFTALVYAVVGKRFGHQRSAIAMAAALGLALAAGLVSWEYYHDVSIRDLGPLAVGFAVIILGMVMFQSIRQVGGSWAGAGIALGMSLIVAWIVGLDWPIDAQIVQSVMTVALIIGVLAFLVHQQHFVPAKPLSGGSFPRLWNDDPAMFDARHELHDDYNLSKKLTRRFHNARRKADHLHEHPEDAKDIMLQLQRMLPAEGHLTERMATLRTQAHRVKNGHIARLEETRHLFDKLPISAKKQASAELAEHYQKMTGMDQRLERLDKAVAENEHRIRDITQAAQKHLTAGNHRELVNLLKDAENLQKHNSRIFTLIDRTEHRLAARARDALQKVQQVYRA